MEWIGIMFAIAKLDTDVFLIYSWGEDHSFLYNPMLLKNSTSDIRQLANDHWDHCVLFGTFPE